MGFRLVIALFLGFLALAAGPPPLAFEHLSTAQGLSQSTVLCILQDHQGFLWFGTEEGLNRFDGLHFKVFRHDNARPDTLGSDWVSSLAEDEDHRLWVGTRGGGLSCLDLDTYKVRRFPATQDAQGLPSNSVTSLGLDRDGSLWIGTLDQGLARLPRAAMPSKDPSRPEARIAFQRFEAPAGGPGHVPGRHVTCFFRDHEDTLWIGLAEKGLCRAGKERFGRIPTFAPAPPLPKRAGESALPDISTVGEDSFGVLWAGGLQGLYSLSPDRRTYARYGPVGGDPGSLGGERVWRVYSDRVGNVWVGTDTGGLSLMLPRPRAESPARFTTFRNDPDDSGSLSSDSVNALLEDRDNVLWVGAYFAPLNRIALDSGVGMERLRQGLVRYRNHPADPRSLSGDLVYGACEDASGRLWVATDGFGLHRSLAPPSRNENLRLQRFRAESDRPGALQDDVVTSLYLDSRRRLWGGTYAKGIFRVDEPAAARPQFRAFRNNPADPSTLGSDFVECFLEDRKHRLWVGTNGGGLNLYDEAAGVFRRFSPGGEDALGSASIYAIREDAAGTLWLATLDSLARFDPATARFKVYHLDLLPGFSTFSNINDLHLDAAGFLWIATNGGGLIRGTVPPWNGADPVFARFDTGCGLPSDVIRGLLPNTASELWVSTNHGVCRFDTQKGRAYAIARQDDAQGLEYLRHSGYRARDGELFFGSRNGLVAFRPEELQRRSDPPRVAFTDFQVFNHSVETGRSPDGRILFRGAIAEAPAVTLTLRDQVVTIGFAALHTAAPNLNHCAYMMEGVDKAWIQVGGSGAATYTTLPPGTFHFRVRACNGDGLWNLEGRTLVITVLPPIHQTWWFRSLVVLVGGLALAWAMRWRLGRANLRNEELERKVEERTRALAASERMANESSRAKSVFLANMSHELRTPLNAILLYGELLEDEAREHGLEQQLGDLGKIRGAGRHLLTLIDDILDLSKIEAGRMAPVLEDLDPRELVGEVAASVRASMQSNGNELVVEADPGIRRFRTDRKMLRQTLYNLLTNAAKFTERGTVTLRMAQELHFLRFQVTDTGMGMSPEQAARIFQEFTQADESITRKFGGTGLGLALCRKFTELLGGELTVHSAPGLGSTFTVLLPFHGAAAPAAAANAPAEACGVLVIDDDPDMREALERMLGKAGIVSASAGGGEEGLRLAAELKPRIITLDVAMPDLDGWEVLGRLKADPVLRDIPVVLITMLEGREKGFALGAADFLSKPITREDLLGSLRRIQEDGAEGREILLVEDDLPIQEALARILEGEGWRVRTAPDGLEALNQLRHRVPQLVVLDLMMPCLDGFQVVAAMQDNSDWREVPVIVLTAKELTEEDLLRLKGPHVFKVFRKGASTRAELVEAVRELARRME